ncbi:MAG: pyrroloquinoline quinone biosynthesis protein [Synechococcaceae bacterium WBA_2_066]|nr:pyrroloquinoline quinone biosynthesis protein [Synechococcaceae bacterium WB6_1A_059]NBP33447.1 pyrroloquinoline quinone biosynthesis protein [Synechococcaceae bacterium WB6_1B_055]NBQ18882.1 pyrroloquinoline quinone biosynthesis protein [Synechococcaceae bacterium WB5_2A_257]NBR43899.1 pyrroloquinoline quinone biosynthesis protein [Synechococcaceae bacterium WB5_2B_268]NBY58964.1 pyrroloquinoline quinone biosynthesis protein [Synechococcaceae bacterium LLD_019]NCU77043.1 pyrroloquinoline q
MGFRYLNRVASTENIKEFLELADLAAGGTDDAGNVFELSRRLTGNPMMCCLRRLQQDPDAAALIQSRQLCAPYDVAAMKQLPKGSLGHTYATVMEALGYDIDFFPDPAFYNNLKTDGDYVNYRVYATHDLHHILSGYSLDNFGELGVISISVGQFSFPGFSFLNLVGLMLSFFDTDKADEDYVSIEEYANSIGYHYDLMTQGMAMGIRAKPLFPMIWEERMAQNLEELRAELGIEPVREGLYSWYSNAAIMAALA